MAGEVWVHGDILCGQCGYDSKEAEQRHVWQDGWERLECPRCRSYDCRPVHSDEDEDQPQHVEIDVPDGLTVTSGIAVLHCLDEDGDPEVIVQDYNDVRHAEALGLLTWGLEAARKRIFYEEG